MLPAPAAFRAAVTRGHTAARELWVLDRDRVPLERVPLLAGSDVLVSSGLVRRTGRLQLPAEERYRPGPGRLIWWDHPFLLRFGADSAWMDLPLLWGDEPEHSVGGGIVSVGVYDALRIVSAEARLSRAVTFEEGSRLADAFRRLLVIAGATDDDAGFDLIDGGASFPTTSTYDQGSFISQILGQWQIDHRLDLFAMPPAVLTLRPVPDPLTTAPIATWARGREVRMLGLSLRYRNRAKNHAIVEGVTADGEPFLVEVFDENPASPVRWGSPGVPDLVASWSSDGITTEDQALAVARSLLVRNAIEEELEVTVPVDPSLDRRDVIRIEDPATDTVGTFMLDTFTVPAAPGSHTIVVRRERSLS